MARLQIAAASQPGLAALRAVFMAHVDFVMAYPGVPRVIFQELQQPQDTALKARVRALMQQYRQLLMQSLMSDAVAGMAAQAPGVYAIYQRGLLAAEPALF